ncbi:hypothetical protein GOP47_0014057 [Adiantum capillus-veneris]|uniref:Uncharacterized protein n=1 Tax=Adiantum capillus-veneris TaxID=13818 RepID=A0A9D4UQE6_ADICA|nr:hypothetical protein GOP47_0014057 [Adiantum capillus-veneris]
MAISYSPSSSPVMLPITPPKPHTLTGCPLRPSPPPVPSTGSGCPQAPLPPPLHVPPPVSHLSMPQMTASLAAFPSCIAQVAPSSCKLKWRPPPVSLQMAPPSMLALFVDCRQTLFFLLIAQSYFF